MSVVAEPRDALARRELSLLVLPRDLVRPAALPEPRLELADLVAQLAKRVSSRFLPLALGEPLRM